MNDPQVESLPSVDFNHLRALHVLLEEASVGRAANRLGITSPAASNALRKLRDLMGDPLLVRSGRAMVRTPLAEKLRAPAAAFVRAADSLMRKRTSDFDATTWRGTFSLLTSDYVYLMLVDRLERCLRRRAPGVDLEIGAVRNDDTGWLRQNEGIAITPVRVTNADINRVPLFREHMVVTMRAGHPMSDQPMTLERYCQLSHVLVSLRGQSGSMMDGLLAQTGHARRVARTVPTLSLAAHVVASSDFVCTFPASFVRTVGTQYGLVTRPLPVDLPAFDFYMSWHRRHDVSPVHSFMRQLLSEVTADVCASTMAAL